MQVRPHFVPEFHAKNRGNNQKIQQLSQQGGH